MALTEAHQYKYTTTIPVSVILTTYCKKLLIMISMHLLKRWRAIILLLSKKLLFFKTKSHKILADLSKDKERKPLYRHAIQLLEDKQKKQKKICGIYVTLQTLLPLLHTKNTGLLKGCI